MSDSEIVWEAPPGRSEFDPKMRQLTQRPMQWGRVVLTDDPDEAQRVALALRAYSNRRGSKWKVSKRAKGADGIGVWAMYVGDDDQE